MAKNEIATIDSGNQLPAFLQGSKTTGLVGLNPEDYIVPRIKLLQGISQEVKDKLPGAEAGVFWLNVLDQPLGSELDFVIINNRIRVLLLAPREDGQGILARADDGKTWVPGSGEWDVKLKGVRSAVKWRITDPDVAKSGLLNFGTANPDDPDSNPAATKFYDYLVYLPKFDMIAVLSLARSQAKKAKDLNGKVTLSRVNMHGLLLKAAVITDTNGTDTFSNYRFALNGYTDEATFHTVERFAEQFKTFKVADEVGEDEGGNGGGRGPSTSDEY